MCTEFLCELFNGVGPVDWFGLLIVILHIGHKSSNE